MEIIFWKNELPLCIIKRHMMMMMHKEMEVYSLAFLISPLAGGVVSLKHVGEGPQFQLWRD